MSSGDIKGTLYEAAELAASAPFEAIHTRLGELQLGALDSLLGQAAELASSIREATLKEHGVALNAQARTILARDMARRVLTGHESWDGAEIELTGDEMVEHAKSHATTYSEMVRYLTEIEGLLREARTDVRLHGEKQQHSAGELGQTRTARDSFVSATRQYHETL